MHVASCRRDVERSRRLLATHDLDRVGAFEAGLRDPDHGHTHQCVQVGAQSGSSRSVRGFPVDDQERGVMAQLVARQVWVLVL